MGRGLGRSHRSHDDRREDQEVSRPSRFGRNSSPLEDNNGSDNAAVDRSGNIRLHRGSGSSKKDRKEREARRRHTAPHKIYYDGGRQRIQSRDNTDNISTVRSLDSPAVTRGDKNKPPHSYSRLTKTSKKKPRDRNGAGEEFEDDEAESINTHRSYEDGGKIVDFNPRGKSSAFQAAISLASDVRSAFSAAGGSVIDELQSIGEMVEGAFLYKDDDSLSWVYESDRDDEETDVGATEEEEGTDIGATYEDGTETGASEEDGEETDMGSSFWESEAVSTAGDTTNLLEFTSSNEESSVSLLPRIRVPGCLLFRSPDLEDKKLPDLTTEEMMLASRDESLLNRADQCPNQDVDRYGLLLGGNDGGDDNDRSATTLLSAATSRSEEAEKRAMKGIYALEMEENISQAHASHWSGAYLPNAIENVAMMNKPAPSFDTPFLPCLQPSPYDVYHDKYWAGSSDFDAELNSIAAESFEMEASGEVKHGCQSELLPTRRDEEDSEEDWDHPNEMAGSMPPFFSPNISTAKGLIEGGEHDADDWDYTQEEATRLPPQPPVSLKRPISTEGLALVKSSSALLPPPPPPTPTAMTQSTCLSGDGGDCEEEKNKPADDEREEIFLIPLPSPPTPTATTQSTCLSGDGGDCEEEENKPADDEEEEIFLIWKSEDIQISSRYEMEEVSRIWSTPSNEIYMQAINSETSHYGVDDALSEQKMDKDHSSTSGDDEVGDGDDKVSTLLMLLRGRMFQ